MRKNYGKVTTHSDHNTIVVKLNIEMKTQEKVSKVRFNTANPEARQKMKNEIDNDMVIQQLFCDSSVDIHMEVENLLCRWECAMKRAFHVVKQNKSTLRGVDAEIKLLLKEEKWIRENVMENTERGRRIAEIQQSIGTKIEEHMAEVMEQKVNDVIKSDKPQSKVWKRV